MSLQHAWSKPTPDRPSPNQSTYWVELRRKCIDALHDAHGTQGVRLMNLVHIADQMATSYKQEEEGDRRYPPAPGPYKPWPQDLA